ncbi:MAG: hypothetical protein PWP23_1502 [Candidatus Sumerlaeota bacterium]|nr:hypothetical protein [Candidatus Sumerlaeota bacterium]
MKNIRVIAVFAWGAFAPLLLTSCSLFCGCPEPCPVAEVPADVPPEESVTPAVPKPRVPEKSPSRSAWPRLFLESKDAGAAPPAVVAGGLVATEEEVALALRASGAESRADVVNNLRQELLILDYLRESGLDDDPEFEARARHLLRSQLVQLVIAEAIEDEALVSEDEVRAVYNERRAQYTQPARVSIRLILVSTEAEAAAVMERLQEGEDFGALASEFSQHSSRRVGGVLEPFSRGTYSTELEDLAFSLRSGEVGSVPTTRGVFIVEKQADSRESITPYETVAPGIRAELEQRKRAEAERRFLEALAADPEGMASGRGGQGAGGGQDSGVE